MQLLIKTDANAHTHYWYVHFDTCEHSVGEFVIP